MDFYHEQHSYHVRLAQSANQESGSDDETSWMMLSREGGVVQLPNENIFYQSQTSLNLSTPSGLSAAVPKFSVKSGSGTVYITTKRVIYLPRPTEQLKAFSAPVLNFKDTPCSSSSLFSSFFSFFSPRCWVGLVKPVDEGNVPPDIPCLEIKLTFKEGDHNAFREAFETIHGRLQYARKAEAETGHNVDEQVPLYDNIARPPAGSVASRSQAAAAPQPGHSDQHLPDKPPPRYEEITDGSEVGREV